MDFVNRFFGHGAILSAYAGEPGRIIPAYVQHGWSDVESLTDAPYLRWVPKLVWSEWGVQQAQRFGGRVEAIAAPFVYLDDGAEARPRSAPGEPPRTIVYPYHIWDYDVDVAVERAGVVRDGDYHTGHRTFAAEIRQREEGDVTVVLYWRDHEDELVRRAYTEQGFRVICHGFRHDIDFLVRQRTELLAHTRAVSNRLGTATWYAGHLGLELGAYGPFPGSSPEEARAFHDLHVHRWPEMFEDGMKSDVARACAADELGAASKRAPRELADLLWGGWRGRLAGAVDLADRAQHRARWPRYLRRAAARPPYWETIHDVWPDVPRRR